MMTVLPQAMTTAHACQHDREAAKIDFIDDACPPELSQNVLEISPGSLSKTLRLDAVMGKITAQYVHILHGIPGVEDFLDEPTAFPFGSNDDQVDLSRST
jgi:phage terminase large subunit-like protein